MLLQIQKELNQKRHAHLLAMVERDRSKYEQIKNEYTKFSVPKRHNVSQKLQVYLLLLALATDDATFTKLLVDTYRYEDIELIEAKIACGRVYTNLKISKKVVDCLYPIYKQLNSNDLTILFESLFITAMHKQCEEVLKLAINRYSQIPAWKIEQLSFQIKMLHLYPKDQEYIENNLRLVAKECSTTQECVRIAQCFYNASFLFDSLNMLDIALQKIIPGVSINDNRMFDSSRCLHVMNDMIDILENHHIKPFPIGGSLLGLVRDGKFMEYDKDADIGIFVNSYDDVFNIVSILCREPRFTAPDMINKPKESHLWNVAIYDTAKHIFVDLFFFHKQKTYIEEGFYTSCGVLKWRFTPFELVRQNLAGKEYWVPSNVDLFLTELFGNWHEPIEVWDSLLNCPNLSMESQPVIVYFGLQRLWTAFNENKIKKALNYYETLITRWGVKFSPTADENIKKLLNLN